MEHGSLHPYASKYDSHTHAHPASRPYLPMSAPVQPLLLLHHNHRIPPSSAEYRCSCRSPLQKEQIPRHYNHANPSCKPSGVHAPTPALQPADHPDGSLTQSMIDPSPSSSRTQIPEATCHASPASVAA